MPKFEIEEEIIRAVKKACEIYGYDIPKTKKEWERLINDLLREKVVEDFGSEVFK